jgi:hypothetical protein
MSASLFGVHLGVLDTVDFATIKHHPTDPSEVQQLLSKVLRAFAPLLPFDVVLFASMQRIDSLLERDSKLEGSRKAA